MTARPAARLHVENWTHELRERFHPPTLGRRAARSDELVLRPVRRREASRLVRVALRPRDISAANPSRDTAPHVDMRERTAGSRGVVESRSTDEVRVLVLDPLYGS